MSSFSSKAKSNPAVSHHRTPERILSEDQVNEIREAFELFAIQSNDCLNYHELKVAMRALGFDLKKAEVFKLLKDHTADGKRIGFDAFNEMMQRKMLAKDPTEDIRRAFKLFDSSGTGKITVRDLKRVAHDLGEQLEDDELKAMIDEFSHKEGEITEEEFIQIMIDG